MLSLMLWIIFCRVLAEFNIRFLGPLVGLEHILHHERACESFLAYCDKVIVLMRHCVLIVE